MRFGLVPDGAGGRFGVKVVACREVTAIAIARLERLHVLMPTTNAMAGIDLAGSRQMVVVTDHDSKVIARRTFRCRGWDPVAGAQRRFQPRRAAQPCARLLALAAAHLSAAAGDGVRRSGGAGRIRLPAHRAAELPAPARTGRRPPGRPLLRGREVSDHERFRVWRHPLLAGARIAACPRAHRGRCARFRAGGCA
jgi:hypothetical protein